MQKVLILGATSTIGRALAHKFGKSGCRLLLAGRSEEELERLASDLQIRTGAGVSHLFLDALDLDSHGLFINQAVAQLEGLDGVVWLIGELGNQPGPPETRLGLLALDHADYSLHPRKHLQAPSPVTGT